MRRSTIAARLFLMTGERIWGIVSVFLIIFLLLDDLNRAVYIAPPYPKEVPPNRVDPYYVKTRAAYAVFLYSTFTPDTIEERYRTLAEILHPSFRKIFEEKFFSSGGIIERYRRLGYAQVFIFNPDDVRVERNRALVRGILEVFDRGKAVRRLTYCYTVEFTFLLPGGLVSAGEAGKWGLLVTGLSGDRC